jgi:hypothetical protein
MSTAKKRPKQSEYHGWTRINTDSHSSSSSSSSSKTANDTKLCRKEAQKPQRWGERTREPSQLWPVYVYGITKKLVVEPIGLAFL